MSGFTENRTPGASEHANAPARLLTWQASKAMLPLVARIARDIAATARRLDDLRVQLSWLDEARRGLDWPQRRRRYQLDEALAEAEAALHQVAGELVALGVSLLDAPSGLVGFPTMVNQRRAYFSWQPGEEELKYWQYAGDTARREVPADWIANPPRRITRGSRPRISR